MKIELEDGKYTYLEDAGTQCVLRYGEVWRDATGDKFIAAMAYEIERLRAELAQWTDVFGHLGTADECGNEWIALKDDLALPHDDSALNERLAQERERCAKVCEERNVSNLSLDVLQGSRFSIQTAATLSCGKNLAAAIRAMGDEA